MVRVWSENIIIVVLQTDKLFTCKKTSPSDALDFIQESEEKKSEMTRNTMQEMCRHDAIRIGNIAEIILHIGGPDKK
jgi:hypothetical protein